MKRFFSDHWKGVAAGLVVFNVGLAAIMLAFGRPTYTVDSARSGDAAFAHVSSPAAPPAQWEARGLVRVMEDQATTVVENPYDVESNPGSGARVLCGLLVLLMSGATAARTGEQVVAWRGALIGVIGTLEMWTFGGGTNVSEAALGCLALGSVTYTGGGLVKLLFWARSRAA